MAFVQFKLFLEWIVPKKIVNRRAVPESFCQFRKNFVRSEGGLAAPEWIWKQRSRFKGACAPAELLPNPRRSGQTPRRSDKILEGLTKRWRSRPEIDNFLGNRAPQNLVFRSHFVTSSQSILPVRRILYFTKLYCDNFLYELRKCANYIMNFLKYTDNFRSEPWKNRFCLSFW